MMISTRKNIMKERRKKGELLTLQKELEKKDKARCANNGPNDANALFVVKQKAYEDVDRLFKAENDYCSQAAIDECLLIAAQHGQKLKMIILLKSGAHTEFRDKEGNTPLMVCAEHGYLDMVKILIANKADRNTTNIRGDTALICAIQPQGSADLARILVSKTNVNVKNSEGYTALMKAIEVGDLNTMRLLMMRGAKTTYILGGKTVCNLADRRGLLRYINLYSDCAALRQPVLVTAIETRDPELIKTILTHEQHCINERDKKLRTALESLFDLIISTKSSISNKDRYIIKLLLSHGINVKKFMGKKKRKRQLLCADSPLVKAVIIGDLDIVKCLCIKGANVNESVGQKQYNPLMMAAKEGNLEILEYLLLEEADIEASNEDGTALDIAVQYGHMDCAKRLLEEKAKHNLLDAYKLAIHFKSLRLFKNLVQKFTINFSDLPFMELTIESGSIRILKYVVTLGMDVNAKFVPVNNYEYTDNGKKISPLHMSIRKGQCDLVKALIDSGADLNETDYTGDNSLMLACSLNETDVLKVLLKSVARLSDVNSKEKALLRAISNDKIKHVRMLLEYGADINTCDRNRKTPLSSAVACQNVEMVCLLLEWDADVNVTLKDGKNYLMFTIESLICDPDSSKCLQIINKLLEHNIDINEQDDEGNTAIMLACKESLQQIVDCLVDNGADVNLRNLQNETAISLAISNKIALPKRLLHVRRKSKLNSTLLYTKI